MLAQILNIIDVGTAIRRYIYKGTDQKHALIDTSDYPPSHHCYTESSKEKLYTFKDETSALPIVEFVDLRAKCYSFDIWNDVEKRLAKGVLLIVITNKLKYDIYKEYVKTRTQTYTASQTIRSDQHNTCKKANHETITLTVRRQTIHFNGE